MEMDFRVENAVTMNLHYSFSRFSEAWRLVYLPGPAGNTATVTELTKMTRNKQTSQIYPSRESRPETMLNARKTCIRNIH